MSVEWSLSGAPNARDLGGLVGADGRTVRAGALIRASGLGRLVDDDLPTLGKLDLSCVVDLRSANEIEVAPPDRLAGEPRVVHIPIHDPQHPVFTYVSAVMLGHDLAAYEALAREGTTGAMEAIYRWFVASPAAIEAFTRAVRTIAEPDNLPLLFHCSAGKDRTGWLSVILLTALGVDAAAIRADYLRTNDLADGVNESIMGAMLVRRPEPRPRRDPPRPGGARDLPGRRLRRGRPPARRHGHLPARRARHRRPAQGRPARKLLD